MVTLRGAPVVEVLPHVLRQDHHQVIDVVVLVGRDACRGKQDGRTRATVLLASSP